MKQRLRYLRCLLCALAVLCLVGCGGGECGRDGHLFSSYIPDGNATCTEDGTKSAVCERCGVTDRTADAGSARGHVPGEPTVRDLTEATCLADGGYDEVVLCSVCGAELSRAHKTLPRLRADCSVRSLSLSVQAGGETLGGTLPAGTACFDFSSDLSLADGAEFSLCGAGGESISGGSASLVPGENRFTLTVKNGMDSAVYSVCITVRRTYTVTFDTAGADPILPRTAEEGSLLSAPSATRAGYDFLGWDYDFDTPITADVTARALFDPIRYTVTYDMADAGSLSPAKNAEENPAAYTVEDTVIFAPPTRTGYTFLGWDRAQIPAGTLGALTVRAAWKAQKCTVTFDTDGGGTIPPVTVDCEEEVALPEVSRAGQTFIGWYRDGERLEGSFRPVGDVTVRAYFTDVFTFSVGTDGSVCVTSVRSDVTDAVIPDVVSAIAPGAFSGCSSLRSLTIPFVGLRADADALRRGALSHRSDLRHGGISRLRPRAAVLYRRALRPHEYDVLSSRLSALRDRHGCADPARRF